MIAALAWSRIFPGHPSHQIPSTRTAVKDKFSSEFQHFQQKLNINRRSEPMTVKVSMTVNGK
ncbi:MAG TPA: hypothetical protein VFI80_05115, partial [Burkholderiales bacterium]|nr:hypothetical protein [Burkholderiales bacterium]